MKPLRLTAMLLLLVALLFALLTPLYLAQKANQRPAESLIKFVPGQRVCITLIRFTIPQGVKFRPPHLAKSVVPPRDMLQFYWDAAQAQHITPAIHVFPALIIRDGETKGEWVGNAFTSAIYRPKADTSDDVRPALVYLKSLDFTPVIRASGYAEVKVQEELRLTTGYDHTNGVGSGTVKDNVRALLKLYPLHVVRLPHSFDNQMNRGILFLTLTPAPDSSTDNDDATITGRLVNVSPSAPEPIPGSAIKLRPITAAISGGQLLVNVQITDFDVTADMVPSVTHAMLNPVNRHNRLLALFQDADKKARPFVITSGIHAADDPRKPHKFFPPSPGKLAPFATLQDIVAVPESHEMIHQTLHLASRVNPDGTAAADIILVEQPAMLPGDFLFPRSGIGNSSGRTLVNFHDSRTILLIDAAPPGGNHHLIFATFTLNPAGKK